MGLVCFRLRGTDLLNQDLLAAINGSGKLHMIPSLVRGRYIIRFCVVAENATEADIGETCNLVLNRDNIICTTTFLKNQYTVKCRNLLFLESLLQISYMLRYWTSTNYIVKTYY